MLSILAAVLTIIFLVTLTNRAPLRSPRLGRRDASAALDNINNATLGVSEIATGLGRRVPIIFGTKEELR